MRRFMQTPMSKELREIISNPGSASKITEQIILNGTNKGQVIEVTLQGKKLNLRQIGFEEALKK